MADEAPNTAPAVDPAPAPEATAAPETVENPTPDEQPAEQSPKTFTQEELDEAIGKRLARERRKWEREQQRVPTAPPRLQPVAEQPAADPAPVNDGLTVEERARQLAAEWAAQQTQAAVAEQYYEREEGAREKYDDFEQVAYNPSLPVTTVMAQAIQASEIGPDVIYHLGSNPKEAARISQLPPILQAREIGKIEAKLAANPPVKRTTTAPAPITPVAARQNGAPAYDTTDPRSIKSMSTSEWIEAERQRQIRKAEASRNR